MLCLQSCLTFASVYICTWSWAHGLETGAPTSVCGSMTPPHGSPQTANSPYTIEVDVSVYRPAGTVSVTIVGTSFQGVLIMARRSGSNQQEPVGTFSDPGAASNLRLSDCSGIAGSAVTHANITSKQNTVLVWNPPAEEMGDLEFVATVAQAKTTWWRRLRSTPLTANYTQTDITTPGEIVPTSSSASGDVTSPDVTQRVTQTLAGTEATTESSAVRIKWQTFLVTIMILVVTILQR